MQKNNSSKHSSKPQTFQKDNIHKTLQHHHLNINKQIFLKIPWEYCSGNDMGGAAIGIQFTRCSWFNTSPKKLKEQTYEIINNYKKTKYGVVI